MIKTAAASLQPASVTLSDIESFAEDFSREHLFEYNALLRRENRQVTRKEINDALWGTISLSPTEVVIIDSPLIQRLRFIRQLGVVHWVYPGAVHTRFEHTLGVLHQVQHLVTAMNTLTNTNASPVLIDRNHLELLRLCALLHDVGHAAFSHVSESALESLAGMETIATSFSKIHRIEQKKLSEIFAFYIVRSQSMKTLLTTIFDLHGETIKFANNRRANVDTIVDKISLAIIGRQIDDRLPLLHEIISGPFDADKLDYFVRDARLAGTPSVLDISRLVQKISIRELPPEDLPKDLAKTIDASVRHCYIFGMKWSGISVLDELHLSRILLYSKIYRHQKVIAIERMIQSAIALLGRCASALDIVRLLYQFYDDELLHLDKRKLRAELRIAKGASEEIDDLLGCAALLLADVRRRRLVVKAFQVQQRYPADPIEAQDEQKQGLIDFREALEHPQEREEFRDALLSEVATILTSESADRGISRTALSAGILIYARGRAPGGSQIARAYLLPSSGQPVLFRDYTVNRAAWVDSYTSDQPDGYVFAPMELADTVYLAMEKLLRIKYGVRLPPSALEASKRDLSSIQARKQALGRVGYYSDAPFDLRPVPNRLRLADAEMTIERFASVVSAYQEPQTTPVSTGRMLRPRERVAEWLRQFESDEHVDCALRCLDAFRMIGRLDTVSALRQFVSAYPEFHGAVVVPFGDAKDSGSIHTYFSADLVGSLISATKSLPAAVKDDDRRIIFVDDFMGSGGQTQDILAAGFGFSKLRKNLGEQRDMFDENAQQHLRRARIGFVFSAAWDEGKNNLRKVCDKMDLNAEIFSLMQERDIPFAFDGALDGIDTEVVSQFRERCDAVGRDLVFGMIDAKDSIASRKKKASERSLGYGNRGMLLGSPFNIPTQTLTLFWAGGKTSGVDWMPLLARRKKL